jgi:hypothetical protein
MLQPDMEARIKSIDSIKTHKGYGCDFTLSSVCNRCTWIPTVLRNLSFSFESGTVMGMTPLRGWDEEDTDSSHGNALFSSELFPAPKRV